MKKRGHVLNIPCLNRRNNKVCIWVSVENSTKVLKERTNLLRTEPEHMKIRNPTSSGSNQEVCVKLHMSESKEIIQSKATKVEPVYARDTIHPREEILGIEGSHALGRKEKGKKRVL